MKKVLFASLLLVGAVGIARADHDRPGRDWMTIGQVNHDLIQLGFTNVSEIEADDGLWKAHAMMDGVPYKVRLDPYDGHVVSKYRHVEDHDRYDHDD